jgi:hypothetical protein
LAGTHAAHPIDGHQTTAALADVAENTQGTTIMALTGENSRCQERRAHSLTGKGGNWPAIHFDLKMYASLHILQPEKTKIFFHKAPLYSYLLGPFLTGTEP